MLLILQGQGPWVRVTGLADPEAQQGVELFDNLKRKEVRFLL